jgi:hypothetical protein
MIAAIYARKSTEQAGVPRGWRRSIRWAVSAEVS